MIWDLAPHDLSIMDHLINDEPEAVVGDRGGAFQRPRRHGLSSRSTSRTSVIAHINVNWLSPVKVRTTLIGGEKKMLVWNDLEADEKIKVYDKGVVTNQRRRVQSAGQLPLGRHVGAQDRAD